MGCNRTASPKGVKSANVNIYHARVLVKDFRLQANARDMGSDLISQKGWCRRDPRFRTFLFSLFRA